jgi:hypothetical protein
MNEFLLKDIKFADTGDLVCKWSFIDVPNTNVRVYYDLESPSWGGYKLDTGFAFYAAENVGGWADADDWDPEATFIECMYWGSAAFDGVRHMYMGDKQIETAGYHNYPDINTHIATLKVIGEIEKKHCREKQKQPTI